VKIYLLSTCDCKVGTRGLRRCRRAASRTFSRERAPDPSRPHSLSAVGAFARFPPHQPAEFESNGCRACRTRQQHDRGVWDRRFSLILDELEVNRIPGNPVKRDRRDVRRLMMRTAPAATPPSRIPWSLDGRLRCPSGPAAGPAPGTPLRVGRAVFCAWFRSACCRAPPLRRLLCCCCEICFFFSPSAVCRRIICHPISTSADKHRARMVFFWSDPFGTRSRSAARLKPR